MRQLLIAAMLPYPLFRIRTELAMRPLSAPLRFLYPFATMLLYRLSVQAEPEMHQLSTAATPLHLLRPVPLQAKPTMRQLSATTATLRLVTLQTKLLMHQLLTTTAILCPVALQTKLPMHRLPATIATLHPHPAVLHTSPAMV